MSKPALSDLNGVFNEVRRELDEIVEYACYDMSAGPDHAKHLMEKYASAAIALRQLQNETCWRE